MSVRRRSRATSRATGKTPRTGRIAPSSASSPTAASSSDTFGGELAGSDENAQRDWQVESGSVFLPVGRREIDRHPTRGKREARSSRSPPRHARGSPSPRRPADQRSRTVASRGRNRPRRRRRMRRSRLRPQSEWWLARADRSRRLSDGRHHFRARSIVHTDDNQLHTTSNSFATAYSINDASLSPKK